MRKKNWKYKDCSIKVIGMADNKARIVIRRKKSGYSKFMNSNFEVNLMLGFIVLNVEKSIVDGKDGLVFEIEQSDDNMHRDLKDVKIWSDDHHEIENLYNKIMQEKKQ